MVFGKIMYASPIVLACCEENKSPVAVATAHRVYAQGIRLQMLCGQQHPRLPLQESACGHNAYRFHLLTLLVLETNPGQAQHNKSNLSPYNC
jgi:hypothetical protein